MNCCSPKMYMYLFGYSAHHPNQVVLFYRDAAAYKIGPLDKMRRSKLHMQETFTTIHFAFVPVQARGHQGIG